MLDDQAFDPDEQLRMYTEYWEKCMAVTRDKYRSCAQDDLARCISHP